uniref:Uncharacterized protein n=1 Tax=Cyclophora tenuis TaxID=216820 RepID=A0A7S1GLR5_CYCTE|mmetsp:Transcript_281/g.456  ORF Transcript_281/g.456 Transcript_281/m.456 type:complete len:341 (+) Transcript_281:3-1025(+)
MTTESNEAVEEALAPGETKQQRRHTKSQSFMINYLVAFAIVVMFLCNTDLRISSSARGHDGTKVVQKEKNSKGSGTNSKNNKEVSSSSSSNNNKNTPRPAPRLRSIGEANMPTILSPEERKAKKNMTFVRSDQYDFGETMAQRIRSMGGESILEERTKYALLKENKHDARKLNNKQLTELAQRIINDTNLVPRRNSNSAPPPKKAEVPNIRAYERAKYNVLEAKKKEAEEKGAESSQQRTKSESKGVSSSSSSSSSSTHTTTTTTKPSSNEKIAVKTREEVEKMSKEERQQYMTKIMDQHKEGLEFMFQAMKNNERLIDPALEGFVKEQEERKRAKQGSH